MTDLKEPILEEIPRLGKQGYRVWEEEIQSYKKKASKHLIEYHEWLIEMGKHND